MLNEALYIIKTIINNPGKLYIPSGADVITPVFAVIGTLCFFSTENKKRNTLIRYLQLVKTKNAIVRLIFL